MPAHCVSVALELSKIIMASQDPVNTLPLGSHNVDSNIGLVDVWGDVVFDATDASSRIADTATFLCAGRADDVFDPELTVTTVVGGKSYRKPVLRGDRQVDPR